MSDIRIKEEQYLLGTILAFPKKYFEVSHKLNEDLFSDRRHRIIYKAIKDGFQKGTEPDLVYISRYVRDNQLDSIVNVIYISELSQMYSPARLEEYAAILVDYSVRDKVKKLIKNGVSKIDDLGILASDVAAKLGGDILTLSVDNSNAVEKDGATVFDLFMEDSKRKVDALKNNTITGVPTDLPVINRHTGGFGFGTLTVIAARPSIGKSSAIKNIINGCLSAKMPCGVFSMEMSSEEVMARLVSERVDKSYRDLGKEVLDMDVYGSRLDDLRSRKLFIDDTASLYIEDLVARMRLLSRKHGVKCFIIDYLQLVKSKTANRVTAIDQISAEIKAVSKELGVATIALAQLGRSVDQREDKKPQMSDLRESGGIENAADCIIMLHRPEQYGITEYVLPDGDKTPTDNFAVWIFCKFRQGTLGEVNLRWNGKLTRFYEDDIPMSTLSPSTEFGGSVDFDVDDTFFE